MTVTRDATSGWWVPASAAEWVVLLTGTAIATPSALWLCQEASGTLADSIGTFPLTKFNAPTYQQAVSGWSRLAVHIGASNDSFFSSGAGLGDIQTASHAVLAIVLAPSTPGSNVRVMSVGLEAKRSVLNTTAPAFGLLQLPGTVTTSGAQNPGSTVRPVFFQTDITHSVDAVQTNQETVNPAFVSTATNLTSYLEIGSDGLGTPNFYVLYGVAWRGSGAELTNTQRSTLLDRIINGPAVTSVSVTPSTAGLSPLGTVQLTATATRADGTTFDCTATAVWSSSSPAAATVSATGLVTGVAGGTSTISATFTSLNATPAVGTSLVTVSGAIHWPYTNRLPEFRCSIQRAGFIEVVLTATPAASEWTSLDLFVSGRPGRAPSRNRS